MNHPVMRDAHYTEDLLRLAPASLFSKVSLTPCPCSAQDLNKENTSPFIHSGCKPKKSRKRFAMAASAEKDSPSDLRSGFGSVVKFIDFSHVKVDAETQDVSGKTLAVKFAR